MHSRKPESVLQSNNFIKFYAVLNIGQERLLLNGRLPIFPEIWTFTFKHTMTKEALWVHCMLSYFGCLHRYLCNFIETHLKREAQVEIWTITFKNPAQQLQNLNAHEFISVKILAQEWTLIIFSSTIQISKIPRSFKKHHKQRFIFLRLENVSHLYTYSIN